MVVGCCFLVHGKMDELGVCALQFNILNLFQSIGVIGFLKSDGEYPLIDHREVLKMLVLKIK